MGHLILPPDLIDNLGPAVTSGRSILMYGPPGNGKSSICQRHPRRAGRQDLCPPRHRIFRPGHHRL